MTSIPQRVFLGVTGASGAVYGLRTLQMLVDAEVEVGLCYTSAARRVLYEECGIVLDEDVRALLGTDRASAKVELFPEGDIGAKPASGSSIGDAAIIAPCSLATLSAVSVGGADSLVERAAQVALKEGIPLVVVPRETPLGRIHLDHLSRLAWAGATILPASPGFYQQPQSIADLVDQLCSKILGTLNIPQSVIQPWRGSHP
ncbi:MAG: UbiX family flavin prenyltransferase [Planctomycetes bacterium]|nr:UbiX family flavin prenyltransferase [Planctomycetota bacterium]